MLVIEDEILQASEMEEEELRLEIIILLFQKNKISSGKGAKLAGITILEFWQELSTRNIDLIDESTYVDEMGNLTL